MAVSREVTRDAFAALLTTALTGVQAVYNHFEQDFKGKSPAVVVASSGSDHSRMTFQGSSDTHFIDVYAFTLRGEAGAAYDDAASDDKVDSIEAAIAAVIDANQVTTNWEAIDFDGRTRIEPKMVGGHQYWVELIPLRFEVF
jgi:hypothetical protein